MTFGPGKPDGDVEQIPELDAIKLALKPGIPYDTSLSIDGHPELTYGYRTDEDAQRLLAELAPIVQGLLDTQQAEIVALLERRARWSSKAMGRAWFGNRRDKRAADNAFAHQAGVLEDFADVLRRQRRRWWVKS